MSNNDLTQSLANAMNDFISIHSKKRAAYDRNETAKRAWSEVKTKLLSDIVEEIDEKGKPRYSNKEKRDHEFLIRIKRDHAAIERAAIETEQGYQVAADMCERAYEQLKTLRALLRYETAELELEAARVSAATVATRYNDDIPF